MMSGFSPLARTAVAAYGGRAQQFFHQRMSFFRGDALAYYFDVNTKYALNKLRLLLCPFIHQGSWTPTPTACAHFFLRQYHARRSGGVFAAAR